MPHRPKNKRGQPAPQHHPTGLDLMILARDMRSQWLISTFGRLSAKLARFGSEPVVRARRRTRLPSERLRLSDRPAM
jgi:hypothetical protein